MSTATELYEQDPHAWALHIVRLIENRTYAAISLGAPHSSAGIREGEIGDRPRFPANRNGKRGLSPILFYFCMRLILGGRPSC